MTQKAFAELYKIPLSTLRKWEQGDSTPPAYVARLIFGTLPFSHENMSEIKVTDDETYYYDADNMIVSDAYGNIIKISEDMTDVNKHNLGIYLSELYEAFHEIQEKFNRDCKYDKIENIIWTKWDD